VFFNNKRGGSIRKGSVLLNEWQVETMSVRVYDERSAAQKSSAPTRPITPATPKAPTDESREAALDAFVVAALPLALAGLDAAGDDAPVPDAAGDDAPADVGAGVLPGAAGEEGEPEAGVVDEPPEVRQLESVPARTVTMLVYTVAPVLSLSAPEKVLPACMLATQVYSVPVVDANCSSGVPLGWPAGRRERK